MEGLLAALAAHRGRVGAGTAEAAADESGESVRPASLARVTVSALRCPLSTYLSAAAAAASSASLNGFSLTAKRLLRSASQRS